MKKPLLLCFLCICFYNGMIAQAPVNNVCNVSAPLLTPGTTCINVSGTMANATNDGTINSCPGTERYDVWYRFVAQRVSQTISLSNIGANFTSPGLQVMTACGGTSLACGTTSVSVNGLTVGVIYYVRVFSTALPIPTTNASFDICITYNDDCAAATTITPGASCGALPGQSLYLATETGGPTSVYASTTYDVWYKFIVPAGITTVQIAISGLTNPTNINSGNTFIEAFNASNCSSISTATSLGVSNTGGLTVADLTPGAQYYFRVFTADNPTTTPDTRWNFSVCVSYPAAPANDECAGAISLTPGVSNTTGRVSNATASAAIPAACSGTADDDVWYSFVAPNSSANITVNGNSTLARSGAMIQLFSGTCGSLSSIACAKGFIRATGLSTGATYYIRVYSFGAAGTSAMAGPSNGAGFTIGVSSAAATDIAAGRMNEIYQQTVLSGPSLLNDPWEITYGPDGYLWITESKGYKVYRMNPATGERTTVLDLSRASNFFNAPQDTFDLQFDLGVIGAQGGMAGLALHPQFMQMPSPQNYVYVSYIKSYVSTAANSAGIFFHNSVVRFTYNEGTGKLESPQSIIDSLPGSNDHNSQRMIVAPVTAGGTNYLFYAAGDMGAGQFGNRNRPNHAQDPSVYEGKILRFNLIPDGDAGGDGWIPNDNPFNSTTQSAVWSTGIRNNQGFAYDTAKGILYGSSHGPYSDDEVNIIERDRNYGHPLVIGFKDDHNYDGSSAGANNGSSCPVIVSETDNANLIGAKYKDPLFSAYQRTTAEINNIYLTNPGNGGWPSEGWSGMDIYTNTLVPGWKNSLILASLKWGRILRLKLDTLGTAVISTDGGDTIGHFDSQNRFRDISFSPDGKDMYVIMDKSAATSGPSTNNPSVVDCPGCVQKYSFLGYANDIATNKSTISQAIDVTTGVNNTCTVGTTVTIDSRNSNYWVPITGPDGNIMAEINAHGQNLGTITSSFYKNAGALRQFASKRYLDRNMTITPANTFSSPVSIRLYISKQELDALIADAGSGVDDISDLKILKNSDNCSPAIASSTTEVTTIYAEAHGANGYVLQGDVNGFSSFYFGPALITLPVQSLAFKGQLVNNATVLQWETDNEKNTDKFIVERSIDRLNFESIGSVKAAGNSAGKIAYSFIDNGIFALSATTVYYRLRVTDLDTKYNYSNTIRIALTNIAGKVTIFPNPASNEITMSVIATTGGEIKWSIIDNSGRVVMQRSAVLLGGKNIIPVNIAKLMAGVYHINVSGTDIDQKIKFRKL